MTAPRSATGVAPNTSTTHDTRAVFDPAALWSLLETSNRGVLITIRRDGRPQASNIGYAYDPQTRIARIISPSTRAKAINLRRDPRAALHVQNAEDTLWLVADGDAELSPVCTSPDDEIGRELISIYRGYGMTGERLESAIAEMVVGRVVIRLRISRVYGGDARNATSRTD